MVSDCIYSVSIVAHGIRSNVDFYLAGGIVGSDQLSLVDQGMMGNIVVQRCCGHGDWSVMEASYGCIWQWSSCWVS